MPYVKVSDDTSLYVEDTGSGKPVVFIHGWPLSSKMFEYQFMTLQKNGYRCIGIDLRGFGKSDKPWGEYNYDIFASDIKKVLDSLSLKMVTLVGFSMGGAIVMHYAAKYRGYGLDKMVLMGAAAPSWTKRADFPHGMEKSSVDALIAQAYSDRPKLLSDFGKIFFSKEEGSVSKEIARWLYSINLDASPYATLKCIEELRDADLRKDMQAINELKIPVSIFHGVQDKICSFDLAKIMNDGITGSKLVRFEKSGHGLNIEEMEKTNEELMKFID
ncbi:alpha/beta hydrolase [Candidatus Nitrosotenuis chungbukensis]|uniref:alpha/beta fold hydrolase n=1 Tax=Candidatus Nitrosotenuis chungbukensis TaxID=1353246 RepID=UPI0005B2B1A8|nr:alpha/beta hydrolase [Candidatus Nitrosotenuis chungbukensis]WKT57794.1 alpha/beta hydrolase [Candidatus Nitrosotenuis chungbukensis]